MTYNRLTMNCVGRLAAEVRTEGSEKWVQLPLPAMKPMATNPAITISLVEVSTFCTFAVRPTPRQFKTVKAAIRADATACPAPRWSENAPEPTTILALACFKAGKKYPR